MSGDHAVTAIFIGLSADAVYPLVCHPAISRARDASTGASGKWRAYDSPLPEYISRSRRRSKVRR